jgi:hypothetical protein
MTPISTSSTRFLIPSITRLERAGKWIAPKRKGSPKTSFFWNRLESTGCDLFPGGNALHGANLGTGAAVGAKLGIDLVNVTLADCAHRALRLAGPAGGAVITNHVGHDNLLTKFRRQCKRFRNGCQAIFDLSRANQSGIPHRIRLGDISVHLGYNGDRKNGGIFLKNFLTYSKIVEYNARVLSDYSPSTNCLDFRV